MGILAKVRQAGYSVGELRLVNARGRKLGGFSTAVVRRMANDRFTSLPRGDLAAIIYQTIEEQVETIFDNTISALEEQEGSVRVSFEKGGSRDFDLVVGRTVCILQCGPWSLGRKASSRSNSGTGWRFSRSKAIGRATSRSMSAMPCPAGRQPVWPCGTIAPCFC